MRSLTVPLVLATLLVASTAVAAETPTADIPTDPSRGDLFPGAGHLTVSGATGLPFLGIAEVGVGITNGIAVGAIGGITPSVVTAGIRPRFRVETSRRTALVLSAPMLWYPKASAPGPGNVGTSSWVLTRTELFLDGQLGERWHVAGGMGFIAAASTEALDQFVRGKEFAMPPYNGSTESRKGFAGGIWNTIAARSSYALAPDTHLFAEGSLVMAGIVPADGVGGPPIVVNVGAQHAF